MSCFSIAKHFKISKLIFETIKRWLAAEMKKKKITKCHFFDFKHVYKIIKKVNILNPIALKHY